MNCPNCKEADSVRWKIDTDSLGKPYEKLFCICGWSSAKMVPETVRPMPTVYLQVVCKVVGCGLTVRKTREEVSPEGHFCTSCNHRLNRWEQSNKSNPKPIDFIDGEWRCIIPKKVFKRRWKAFPKGAKK